jgi:uncharacterized protein (TIGR04255 family)
MDLPEYTSKTLARSPLVLVAAQINFEDIGAEVRHSQARHMQKLVGSHWTQLQAAPQMKTTMTPAGAVNEPNRNAYRLLSADGSWAALLNPDSVTLETRSYPGWGQMLSTIEAFAEAIAEVYDPSSEIRLGLRYVDQVPLPDTWEGWKGLIPDHLLGILIDPRFEDGILGSEQRVLLRLDEQIRCILRHGLIATESDKPGSGYLLDYDLFRENCGGYSADSVTAGADALHAYAGRLFRASITDELYAWLDGGLDHARH